MEKAKCAYDHVSELIFSQYPHELLLFIYLFICSPSLLSTAKSRYWVSVNSSATVLTFPIVEEW